LDERVVVALVIRNKISSYALSEVRLDLGKWRAHVLDFCAAFVWHTVAVAGYICSFALLLADFFYKK
jgi:hypothetical protein